MTQIQQPGKVFSNLNKIAGNYNGNNTLVTAYLQIS